MPPNEQNRSLLIEEGGGRVDAYIAAKLPELSRARVQQLLKAGDILVNDQPVKPRHLVVPGDVITVQIPPPVEQYRVEAQEIPLEIVYQDADLLVLNKPSGLVVHPGAGNRSGTLVNALLHHVRDLSGIGGELRPGIVHRLDKDTSGLMLVAKHDAAHRALAEMITRREVRREYMALAWGRVSRDEFTVDAPIGRHPTERQRMAVLEGNVPYTRRHAVTHFTVLERMAHATALAARLETGRTHQIRVHLLHAAHPVVGDPVYGTKIAGRHLALLPAPSRAVIEGLPGQALHAFRLSFPHPMTGEALCFQAAPPAHFQRAWEVLRAG